MPSLISFEIGGWIKDGKQANAERRPHAPQCKAKNKQQGEAGCNGLEQDGATMLSGQIATPDRLYQCDSCLPPTLTQPVAGGHWSLQTCLPEVYFSR